MRNLLKKYRILLLILIIPNIFFIIFFTVPSKYEAYIPGDVELAGKVIKVKNNLKESNNYYSTSVTCLYYTSLFQKIFFDLKRDSFIVKKSNTISTKDDIKMGEIEHNSAVYTSIISAYNLAGIPLDYTYYGTYVYYTLDPNLRIGDIVLGSSYNDSVDNLKSLNFDIFRDGKVINLKLDTLEKTYLEYGSYEINNNDIVVYDSKSLGPSAGFMQALKLYDDLISDDLSHNLKIAGTGTIDEDGNVGIIGAVDIKIYTAIYNKIDIFFVPKDNYEDALKAYNSKKTNMKLVMVETLEDAVNYLKNYE